MMMDDSGIVFPFVSSRTTGNLPIGQIFLNAALELRLAEIDEEWREWSVVLVESDQNLPAERRQRDDSRA